MKRLLLLLLWGLGVTAAYSQQGPIKGRVTDENDKPVPGATVTVKNTHVSTTTDSLGNFQISSGGQIKPVLIVTSVGYGSEQLSVSEGGFFRFHLQQEARSLNDVVVVGYGTQRKSTLTGATSQVKAEEIAKRPIVRVEEALQGTTPGVSVASTSGMPGVPLAVRIRGSNSITGSNEPLYVIDGFIGGNIESVPAADIESMEILKDAAATAIYGSRGSNGVVMITTKSGKEGKARIDFNFWEQNDQIPKELSLLNAYQFATAVNAQYAFLGQAPGFSPAQLEGFQTNPGTNWQKALQRKPWVNDYNLVISGGTAAVNYLFSLDHLDQPGLIVNQFYKRTTFRTNIGVKVNDRLNLQFNVAAVIPESRNNGYQGDITDPFAQAYQFDPTSPVRDSNGNFVMKSQFASNGTNPVAQATNSLNDANSTDITGTGRLTYRLFKGLTFTSDNYYEINNNQQLTLNGPLTSSGLVGEDYAATNNGKGWNFQNSNFLTYHGNWGDHNLTVTAVYEQTRGESSNTNARSNNLSTYALGYYNLGLGSTQIISSGYSESSTQSYVGRINYSYEDKYLFSASLRDDGSSHLIQKYSLFPSVGLGWNIAKEKFLDNSKFISNLKIRGSYGVSGNQAVGAFSSISQIGVGGIENASAYFYDGHTPSIYTPLGTPAPLSLKWEDDAQTDVGIDAGFFRDRLTFTADAYDKHVTNLLYNQTAPQYLGGSTYASNLGSLTNKGFEFGIGATPVLTGKFKWTTYYNMSFNTNKIDNLIGVNNVVVNNIGSAQTGVSILKIGKPLGEFYGYDYLGTWKTGEASEAAKYGNKPGDSHYLDVNNDGAITGADEVPIGNGLPKYTFGFINDFTYGNFTLSVMFQGTHGNQIYSGTFPYTMGGQGDARNATSTDILNIWTPTNQTNIPTFSPSSQNYINSSRFVYDASYVKMRNISLSYHVPENLLGRVKMRNLEIYVSGQNLLTFTKYPGYDPEVSNQTNGITQGLETGVIPNPKTYTFGIRAGF